MTSDKIPQGKIWGHRGPADKSPVQRISLDTILVDRIPSGKSQKESPNGLKLLWKIQVKKSLWPEFLQAHSQWENPPQNPHGQNPFRHNPSKNKSLRAESPHAKSHQQNPNKTHTDSTLSGTVPWTKSQEERSQSIKQDAIKKGGGGGVQAVTPPCTCDNNVQVHRSCWSTKKMTTEWKFKKRPP